MYSKVLDVWEGNPNLDEAEFARGGVVGLIVRLNGMGGGHRMDTNFLAQWSQSQNLSPAPYFVYNPWVNGQANYDWLATHVPTCPTVFIDVEVVYAGYPAATYGAELGKFIKLCQAKWHTVIYTGAGFAPTLAPWPPIEYWWSQWPYPLYPSATSPKVNITWPVLDALLAKLPWPPANAAKCAGTIRLHQCSGDRFYVPGCATVMDVSVFPGTAEQYRAWIGYPPILPPAVLTPQEQFMNWAKAMGYPGPSPF